MKGPWAIPNDPRMYEGDFAAVERHREAVDEQLGDERPNQDDEPTPLEKVLAEIKPGTGIAYDRGHDD